MKQKYRDLLMFIAILFFTIILELSLDALKVKEENIYLVFVLAILIIIIELKSIIYGLLASVVTVLSFNFFITEPRLTFVVDDPNYYVSFMMFIVVSFMVNSLVIQLQRQIRLSKENERQINALYNISTDILNAGNNAQIYESVIDRIQEQTGGQISIVTCQDDVYGYPIEPDDYRSICKDCLENNRILHSKDNPDLGDDLLFPIRSISNDYGILLLNKKQQDPRDQVFIENVIEEMIIALDRNDISLKQEQTKVQVEKEKFKTALLRGLSHDLKTPLTMIQSGSDFLYESFAEIPDTSKKELIRDIFDESCNLSQFVNNLLDMTRLENKDVKLNRKLESAEDIIYEVLEKMKRRLEDTSIEVEKNEELVMVYADTDLLTQVFVNLIENALIHTRQGSSIRIRYFKEKEQTVFEVEDNGGGIKEEKLDKIFDDFYSYSIDQDKRRSHGLGLAICKAIVEAHGGEIQAENNAGGGTTFRFTIRDKDESYGENSSAGRR